MGTSLAAAAGDFTRILEHLRVLQFGDSGFPVGAFAFSNGLEPAVQRKVVHDRATLRQFVMNACSQAASGDAIALLVAHRAARNGDLAAVLRADAAVFNRKLNDEMRTMTVRMGKKLGEMTQHLLGDPFSAQWLARVRSDETPGTYPISLGLLFAGLQLPEQDAFAVHQYGTANMILGASLRLMRLDHFDAQAILFEVNSSVDDDYARVAAATLEEMATFSPLLDILAAEHVRSHVRMFMN
jgi:urease accessory protein